MSIPTQSSQVDLQQFELAVVYVMNPPISGDGSAEAKATLAQATEYIQRISTLPNAYQLCLQLLLGTNKSEARFFSLQALCQYIDKGSYATLPTPARVEVREAIFHILQTRHNEIMGEAAYVKAKFAQAIALLIHHDMPEVWMNPFVDLIQFVTRCGYNTISPERLSTLTAADLAISRSTVDSIDFLYKVLQTVHTEIVDLRINRTSEESSRSTKVKDSLRPIDVPKLVEFTFSLVARVLRLTEFGVRDMPLIHACRRALSALSSFAQWTEIGLFSSSIVAPIYTRLLSVSEFRGPAVELLQALIEKGMDDVLKLQLVLQLHLPDVAEALVTHIETCLLPLRHKNRFNTLSNESWAPFFASSISDAIDAPITLHSEVENLRLFQGAVNHTLNSNLYGHLCAIQGGLNAAYAPASPETVTAVRTSGSLSSLTPTASEMATWFGGNLLADQGVPGPTLENAWESAAAAAALDPRAAEHAHTLYHLYQQSTQGSGQDFVGIASIFTPDAALLCAAASVARCSCPACKVVPSAFTALPSPLKGSSLLSTKFDDDEESDADPTGVAASSDVLALFHVADASGSSRDHAFCANPVNNRLMNIYRQCILAGQMQAAALANNSIDEDSPYGTTGFEDDSTLGEASADLLSSLGLAVLQACVSPLLSTEQRFLGSAALRRCMGLLLRLLSLAHVDAGLGLALMPFLNAVVNQMLKEVRAESHPHDSSASTGEPRKGGHLSPLEAAALRAKARGIPLTAPATVLQAAGQPAARGLSLASLTIDSLLPRLLLAVCAPFPYPRHSPPSPPAAPEQAAAMGPHVPVLQPAAEDDASAVLRDSLRKAFVNIVRVAPATALATLSRTVFSPAVLAMGPLSRWNLTEARLALLHAFGEGFANVGRAASASLIGVNEPEMDASAAARFSLVVLAAASAPWAVAAPSTTPYNCYVPEFVAKSTGLASPPLPPSLLNVLVPPPLLPRMRHALFPLQELLARYVPFLAAPGPIGPQQQRLQQQAQQEQLERLSSLQRRATALLAASQPLLQCHAVILQADPQHHATASLLEKFTALSVQQLSNTMAPTQARIHTHTFAYALSVLLSPAAGLAHPHPLVRERASYLLMKLVKSVARPGEGVNGAALGPFVPLAFEAIQPLLSLPFVSPMSGNISASDAAGISDPWRTKTRGSSGLGSDDTLQLFEMAGYLVGHHSVGSALRISLSEGLTGPLIAAMNAGISEISQRISSNPLVGSSEFEQLKEYAVHWVSLQLSAISSFAKGMGAGNHQDALAFVLERAQSTVIRALSLLPNDPVLRGKTLFFLHRMLDGLDSRLVPTVGAVLPLLLQPSSKDLNKALHGLRDVVTFFSAFLTKFKIVHPAQTTDAVSTTTTAGTTSTDGMSVALATVPVLLNGLLGAANAFARRHKEAIAVSTALTASTFLTDDLRSRNECCRALVALLGSLLSNGYASVLLSTARADEPVSRAANFTRDGSDTNEMSPVAGAPHALLQVLKEAPLLFSLINSEGNSSSNGTGGLSLHPSRFQAYVGPLHGFLVSNGLQALRAGAAPLEVLFLLVPALLLLVAETPDASVAKSAYQVLQGLISVVSKPVQPGERPLALGERVRLAQLFVLSLPLTILLAAAPAYRPNQDAQTMVAVGDAVALQRLILTSMGGDFATAVQSELQGAMTAGAPVGNSLDMLPPNAQEVSQGLLNMPGLIAHSILPAATGCPAQVAEQYVAAILSNQDLKTARNFFVQFVQQINS